MTQQPGEYPEDGQRGQYGGYGHDQGQSGHQFDPNYGQPYGHDAGYVQGQRHRQPDQNYGQDGYGQVGEVQQVPNQDYGRGYHPHYEDPGYGQYGGAQPGYRYDQGGYGADQNYGADQGYPPPAVQMGPQHLAALLTLDDGSNRQYQLAEGSTVVGRGQDAQFRLPDTGVSRRHLEITWDGRTAMLADLGSTNGTTVNGTPVQTWQLVDGDVVRVGHSALVFRTQG